MKISLNWIKHYVGEAVPAGAKEALIAKIGAQIGAIEEVTHWGERYDGVVVAKVAKVQDHPDAERLHVVLVDDGGAVADVERHHNGLVQVVCGASNLREGMLVAWIPPQAILPSSHPGPDLVVLDARELRGVMSNGMLASPRELLMSDEHAGILEVDQDVPPGTPFKKLYGLDDDTIIDIENKMFTHRPDCFGQLGVAREIAGIQNMAFTSPSWYRADASLPATPAQQATLKLTVHNEIPELCPRYMAVVLDNITIAPSPIWLQSYLKRVGIRPINNIVDVTNYMMVLTGQPLHAFDFDKVTEGQDSATIVVRKPRTDETLTLLDGKTIKPHPDAVLICNQEKPLGLGGMMGGAHSEIDAHTKRIIIESATFNLYNIRKTSMMHGIFTDAVTRFSKGQSPQQCPAVLAQAISMVIKHSHAQVASDVIDDYPKPQRNRQITLSADFVNHRLGSSFTPVDIARFLQNVECEVALQQAELTVTPPFWRMDIEIAEDVVEEIGRLYGFSKLPLLLPTHDLTPPTPDTILRFKSQLTRMLARAGANELKTYSFVHQNLLGKVGQDSTQAYTIRNALSPDLQHYRLSLTPSLLDKVHANIRQGFDEFMLFELNRVHQKNRPDPTALDLPEETERLALVMAADDKTAQAQYAGAPFYQAKETLEYLANRLGVAFTYVPLRQHEALDVQLTAPFEPARAAMILLGSQPIGVVGEYRRAVQRGFKLPDYSVGFELDVAPLLVAHGKAPSVYQALSQFPATEQDVCFKVENHVSYESIYKIIKQTLGQQAGLSVIISPVDIYQRPEDNTHKQMTYRIKLRHDSRTLTTEEVNDLLDAIVNQAAAIGAQRV